VLANGHKRFDEVPADALVVMENTPEVLLTPCCVLNIFTWKKNMSSHSDILH
jgi:hypothetical protein